MAQHNNLLQQRQLNKVIINRCSRNQQTKKSNPSFRTAYYYPRSTISFHRHKATTQQQSPGIRLQSAAPTFQQLFVAVLGELQLPPERGQLLLKLVVVLHRQSDAVALEADHGLLWLRRRRRRVLGSRQQVVHV